MEDQNVYFKPVTLKSILKFAVPTIVMTVFMSFYTMVDGLFVSNLIGTNALSAINLTAPVIQFVTAVSTMLATGGSAVIMKKMGQKKSKEAKEDFTFLILVNVIVGIIMWDWIPGSGLHVCWNESFSRCRKILYRIRKPLSGIYRAHSPNE